MFNSKDSNAMSALYLRSWDLRGQSSPLPIGLEISMRIKAGKNESHIIPKE